MKVKKDPARRYFLAAWALLLLLGGYVSLSPRFAMPLYHKILFFPWKYPSGYYEETVVNDIPAEDVWFHTHTGSKLHGWYYDVKGAKQAVLIHHGQGANLTVLRGWAKIFVDHNVSVLLYDYAGFGKSEGTPSIEELQEDGVTAFDFLCNVKKFPSVRIVNCGESLGTGVAAYVTEKRRTAGLILFSPYASLGECSQQVYPILYAYPKFLFPDTQLECRTCLSHPHPPVLIIHAVDDMMINICNSDELFRIAQDPKKYIRLSSGGHDPLNWDYPSVLDGFLKSLHTQDGARLGGVTIVQ